MKQDWRNKRSAFEDRIEESVNELRQANQDYEFFVKENKIEINRTPHKPNKFLKLIKILITSCFVLIEISLNFDALAKILLVYSSKIFKLHRSLNKCWSIIFIRLLGHNSPA